MGRHRGARPKMVTFALLEKWEACTTGKYDFNRLFPDGGEVTFQNVLKAYRRNLDLDWFLHMITTRDQYKAFRIVWFRLRDESMKRRRTICTKMAGVRRTPKVTEKTNRMIKEEFSKWERTQARLFMKVWRGTLFKEKGGKDGKA